VYVRAVPGQAPVPSEPDVRVPRAAWKVVDLVIDGDDTPIGAPLLRELPLAAIETLLNEPSVDQQLTQRLRDAADDLRVTDALSHFEVKTSEQPSRKLPQPERPLSSSKRRPVLKRPANRKLTDEFLQQLAEFYIFVVANGERPLVAIEEAATVPRNTAARWVAMARKRGFLATDTSLTRLREERDDQTRTPRNSRSSRKQ